MKVATAVLTIVVKNRIWIVNNWNIDIILLHQYFL